MFSYLALIPKTFFINVACLDKTDKNIKKLRNGELGGKP